MRSFRLRSSTISPVASPNVMTMPTSIASPPRSTNSSFPSIVGLPRPVVDSALAEGDLTETMRGEFQGAFGELQSNVNQTMANLRSVLGEVRAAINTINGGAGEMRMASGDLSKRTEQQAASLEETSSALEEITAAVKSSTERATEASHMVD